MLAEPPPTYSPESAAHSLNATVATDSQILIVPHSNGLGFQKGFLGVEGEHAAIEGELHIKGFDGHWAQANITLRTVEAVPDHEVEIASTEITLFSALGLVESTQLSSIYPFSIPLPPDTPQCLHTPSSSLLHTLTATLRSTDPTPKTISSSVVVHIRRYTSHSNSLAIAPELKSFDDPTHVEVQVPRTTFRVGEPVPLYIKVPPPRRELVLEAGIRLRNVRAELVRVVSTPGQNEDGATNVGDEDEPRASASTRPVKTSRLSSLGSPSLRPYQIGPDGHEVIALSGAACRLHPSRTLQLRLVLHPPQDDFLQVPSSLYGNDTIVPPEASHEPGVTCATITQATLLHEVSFVIYVHITFMHMKTRTERVSTITIPVTIIPVNAPLPEVEESVDQAYHKKHDRPPARTNRHDDVDVPHYSESEAGPSYSMEPPPFEEREAPPPFPSEPEASTSRLPTFLESESEIYMPAEPDPSLTSLPPAELAFEGEGILFGFTASQQFDGHHEQDPTSTPPPSMEMATLDPDVTNLATLDDTAALNALELALERHQDATNEHAPPPPPPPMDDPSDPPPSIDSDFRAPASSHLAPVTTTHPSATTFAHQLDASTNTGAAAPPPYHVPNEQSVNHDHDNVVHPPPYVDLVPANASERISSHTV